MISGYSGSSADPSQQKTILRLQEMGFVPGAKIIIRHRGVIGGEPLAVGIRGALMAIGKLEADLIKVQTLDEGNSY